MTFNMSNVPEKDRKILLYISDDDLATVQRYVDENVIGDKYVQSKKIYSGVMTELNNLVPKATFCTAFSLNVKLGRVVGIAGARGKGYRRVGPPAVASHKTTPAPPPPELKPEPEPELKEELDAILRDDPLGLLKENEDPAPEVTLPAPKVLASEPTAAVAASVPSYASATGSSAKARIRDHAFSKHTNRVWIGRKCYKLFDHKYEMLTNLVFKVVGGKQEEGGAICFNGKQYTVDDVCLFERVVEHILVGYCEGESDPVLDDGSGMPLWLQKREPREPVAISATSEEKKAITAVDEASRLNYEDDEEEEEKSVEANGVETEAADDVIAASCESMHLGSEPMF